MARSTLPETGIDVPTTLITGAAQNENQRVTRAAFDQCSTCGRSGYCSSTRNSDATSHQPTSTT